MTYRIITHTGCGDGYSSAFIFKRYLSDFIGMKQNSKEIKSVEVIGINPGDVQTGLFAFKESDIVLDLPEPKMKVFFWSDHHLTSKPIEEKNNYFWKESKSCSGVLIDLAESRGIKIPDRLKEFRSAIDKTDSADYSEEDIKKYFYLQDNYDLNDLLQRLMIIRAMIHTKDQFLNEQLLKTILSLDLGETPVDGDELWKLNPLMYHIAHLTGFHMWRNEVDKYIFYNAQARCVVQDDRNERMPRGIPDRFYSSIKFPESIYSVSLKLVENNMIRIGINCNPFKKDECMFDIGLLCHVIGKKFGDGSGGGHYGVGGTMVNAEKADTALKFILKTMRDAEQDEASSDK